MAGRIGDDFDLESAFSDDSQIDALFADTETTRPIDNNKRLSKTVPPQTKKEMTNSFLEPVESSDQKKRIEEERKRTSKDFELNMDAILLTAQSAMIIEGIKCYSTKDFSPATLPIYIEALKGIDLYIKIIDRNPTNYNKLKTIIDTDIDCQRVENTAFNLFKKLFGRMPDDNSEKIIAFEKFRLLFENAKNKATISTASKTIKKYCLLSGGVDKEKVNKLVQSKDRELLSDINALLGHIQLAIEMVKTGNFEIVQGLRGRDLNAFIINSSELLSYYFRTVGNIQAAAYYERIHTNYKKYFITK
ncbi:MAG: hypothetical protein N2316_04290 [Spirochaetes bacterium]|nr:hypothetical protein [Spirochaetota bacterium]